MSVEDQPASLRIVVADDDWRAREALVALLQTWPGFDVVGRADDGAQAVELVAELEPDVVVLDAIMPRMDGLEAARRIRRDRPSVGLILLTLYGALETEAVEAGFDAFLLKSDAIDVIAMAVQQAAGRRPTDAAVVELV